MSESLSQLLAPSATAPLVMLFGAGGVACSCIWPLLASRNRMLTLQVAGSLMFGLQYLFLGAHTAAVMGVVGAVQGVAATQLRPAPRNVVFAITIAVSLLLTALTWQGVTSALAQGGQLLSALGRLRRYPQQIRWSFLASEAFWSSHNLLVGSLWGLISDAMAVTTLLLGLWRGRRRPDGPATG
jgi:hypothetical protein